MPGSLHTTLIIRLSSVGDIVLSSLLVRTLHRRFPECAIDFCVKEEFADLVRWNPHISRVLVFPAGGGMRELNALRRSIRDNDYDLIADIHDSLRSRWLCAGRPRVVRIDKRKLARFMLVKLKRNTYSSSGGSPSVALRYLEPVRPWGVQDDGGGLEVFAGESERQRAAALLRSAGYAADERFIGLCPSAKHRNKMWLQERFAAVAATLSAERNLPVMIFGSEGEHDRCVAIATTIRTLYPRGQVMNLAGRLSLGETAVMMDSCAIVISNDSGLMHMAAARKRRVLAIFGPTVEELGFFPFGTTSMVVENKSLPCRPCTHIGLPDCPEGHFRCMRDIAVEQVLDAARSLLHAQQR